MPTSEQPDAWATTWPRYWHLQEYISPEGQRTLCGILSVITKSLFPIVSALYFYRARRSEELP